jgi:excisionase family DNA binding protein
MLCLSRPWEVARNVAAPTDTTPPLLLRVDEAARRLAISRATAYRLIRHGNIPTIHIGASVRIPTVQLERWVEAKLDALADEVLSK